MIELDLVHQELARQPNYTSVVELAMILEANVSEVRQRLNELGDRVSRNEHDEWRIVLKDIAPHIGDLVEKLERLPLSEEEIQERNELENTVSQAFFVAGQALKTLRDKRLYRETHSTFEAYIKDKFEFKKSAAYYLINASEVVENLKRPQFVDKNPQIEIQVLPTKESQCRPIAKLAPERQREIWYSAVERAGGRVPSARIVKEVVNEIKGVEPVFNSNKKKDGPVRVSGIGVEYVAVLEEETYWMLKEYQSEVGVPTFNGAIRRLLDEEKSRSDKN